MEMMMPAYGLVKCPTPANPTFYQVIIEDSKKAYYYRGLAKWRNEKGWLIDTCLDGQDTFGRLLAMLEIDN